MSMRKVVTSIVSAVIIGFSGYQVYKDRCMERWDVSKRVYRANDAEKGAVTIIDTRTTNSQSRNGGNRLFVRINYCDDNAEFWSVFGIRDYKDGNLGWSKVHASPSENFGAKERIRVTNKLDNTLTNFMKEPHLTQETHKIVKSPRGKDPWGYISWQNE